MTLTAGSRIKKYQYPHHHANNTAEPMAQRGIRIEKIIEYETTLPHFCKNQVRIVLTDFVQRSLPILQVQKSKDELHDFLLFFLQENL